MLEKRSIDISLAMILKVVAVFLALWFIYLVLDIVAMVIISLILVSLIDPIVDVMQRKKIPRPLGVTIVYSIMLALVIIAVSLIIPPIVNQTHQFFDTTPVYGEKIENLALQVKEYFHIQNDSNEFFNFFQTASIPLTNLSGNIFSGTISLFSGLVSTLVVLVMSFYLTVEEQGVKKFIKALTPEKYQGYICTTADRIKLRLGQWMNGQLILMLIIFFLDFIGLSLIGIPYPLVLALFAGFMEFIPYIGPIVAAVPGVLLGLLVSPTKGLMALILYIIAQQFESNIITPQVMRKTVGLHPIVVMLALLIGLKLGGILGAVLAIPIVTVGSLFLDDYLSEKKY